MKLGIRHEADNKSMFRLVRSLGTKQKAIYPEFCSTEDGCSKFAQHFSEKVRMIHAELEVPRSLNPLLVEKTCFTEPLVSFEPTSEVEIKKIVLYLTISPVNLIRCHANRFSSACHHWCRSSPLLLISHWRKGQCHLL